ncbi:putative Peptidase S41 [Seiridium unicorne]|uniref:Peptidase S41 n=1 Tax=Seiridium unicorne TaxID=138068 RepID=A0ABR2V090_9PEZI
MKYYMITITSFSLASAALLGARDGNSTNACASISQQYEKASQTSITSPTIAGQIAHDCLMSLPFDASRADDFLTELGKYVQSQSTLEALKNPPSAYLSPATDILGGLDIIRSKVGNNTYSSQYEFDTDIFLLANFANDGHFSLDLCSLSIFAFNLQAQAIASVSKDGLALPELYLFEEAQYIDSTTVNISSVANINGVDAFEYLSAIADLRRRQDPDSRWNQLYPSYAVLAGGDASTSSGAFTFNYGIWPGYDSTLIEFSNGSSLTPETQASLVGSSFNVSSGEDVYEAYCIPQPTAAGESSSTVAPPEKTGPKAYPKPFLRDPYNEILGHYTDNETVVMQIPTFETSGGGLPDNQSAVFSQASSDIIHAAVSSGRSKITIDVSGNGGGNIDRAFDLFRLFFPAEFPYSATRFRVHDASTAFATIYGSLNQSLAQEAPGPFGYRGQVEPDQMTDFSSEEDFVAGGTQLGVNVSSLFANFNFTWISGEENPIHGFGSTPSETATSPFKAEDILIVSDGICASTCTTFVNLMTNVGGVRALAFGGRPRQEPMQIMGGVRGGQSAGFNLIEEWVSTAAELLQNATAEGIDLLTPDELEHLNSSIPQPLEQLPLTLSGNLNFRNAYQEENPDHPLQFEYQAADCRLFYTYENIRNPATTWLAASQAIWGNGSCVPGSTGGRGSRQNGSQGGNATFTGGSGNSTGGGVSISAAAPSSSTINTLLLLGMVSCWCLSHI